MLQPFKSEAAAIKFLALYPYTDAFSGIDLIARLPAFALPLQADPVNLHFGHNIHISDKPGLISILDVQVPLVAAVVIVQTQPAKQLPVAKNTPGKQLSDQCPARPFLRFQPEGLFELQPGVIIQFYFNALAPVFVT